MQLLSGLKTKIFADGADKATMFELCSEPYIRGFTTNPTLMRNAGVTDYETFAREVISAIPDRPISFEVLADECAEMERQARKISGWGPNVYVKIPVTNTKGQSTADLVKHLAQSGLKLNVTALFSLDQIREMSAALADGPPAGISVFAGRIADTGVDPVPLMSEALKIMKPYPHLELIWASPREVLNIFQADAIGCPIITVTTEILKKLSVLGKDLCEYSLDTVKMFHQDAVKSGLFLR
jgi:transaldolase